MTGYAKGFKNANSTEFDLVEIIKNIYAFLKV